MAIKTNTFTSYSSIGNREDLSDVISNISPTDTPFQSMAGKGPDAQNTFFEWQIDALDVVDTANAKLEGDDYDSAGLTAVTPTTRVGNYCQISAKTIILSGTQQKVRKAGRKSELAYQIAKRGKELKRDMEGILLSNQAAVAGNSTTARKTGSLLAFIKSNDVFGATGASPVYTSIPNAARTDGTQQDITEARFKSVVQLVYSSGGTPKVAMLGPVNKMNFSKFAGIAQTRFDVKSSKPSTIIGAADVYVSDFGNITVVPNRFQRERDMFVLDPDFFSISYLRPFITEDLAKTGDADKKLLLAEYGLRVENEAALGSLNDLNTAIIP